MTKNDQKWDYQEGEKNNAKTWFFSPIRTYIRHNGSKQGFSTIKNKKNRQLGSGGGLKLTKKIKMAKNEVNKKMAKTDPKNLLFPPWWGDRFVTCDTKKAYLP